MSSEWSTLTIGDLVRDGEAAVQTGPFGSQLHSHEYVDVGTAVIPTEAIGRGRILEMQVPMVSELKAMELARHRLHMGDILFARRGAQATGLSAIVDKRFVGALCGTGALLLRVQSPRVDSQYLAMFLSSDTAYTWLRTHAVGAVMPNINTDIIKALPITLPGLDEQRSLAKFVGAMDDRITLLRETNATLEAIAQALFKSWFVDFDPVRAKMEGRIPEGMDEATAALFPDAFEEIESGLMPKGWQLCGLGRLIDLTKGCSYKGEGLSEAEGAYMFNLGCFNAHRVYASEKVKRYTGEYKPRHAVEAGDLIIANTDMTQARDILGRPAFVPDGLRPGFVSHHVYKVTVLPEWADFAPAVRSFLFFALQLASFRERAIGFATGTTVLALPAAAVLGSVTPFPSKELLTVFGRTVDPLFDAIATNEQRAANLTELRDTLLPRLISGQLRLPEAQDLIEETC